jgi:hypothetical protein
MPPADALIPCGAREHMHTHLRVVVGPRALEQVLLQVVLQQVCVGAGHAANALGRSARTRAPWNTLTMR